MSTITIEPASPDRFDDVELALTGGGDGTGCQCQWWTISNADFQAASTDERERMLRREVADGPPPGLIAYVDGEAAGWVRVGPRAPMVRITRTREIVAATEHPLDDPSVWVISCFSVRREHRGNGLMPALLRAAVAHARESGATVIEGYPLDPTAAKKSSSALYRGTVSAFVDEGFRIVARPKPDRAVVSLDVG